MPPIAKELFRGTSYTEGNTSKRYDRARMTVFVYNLTDNRNQLDQAIATASSGRLVHPDNTALPLRYASARWVRGDDGADCGGAALVELVYDKTGSQSATDSTEFSVIADVRVFSQKKFWYGKTLADPVGIGTGNGSTNVYATKNPFAPTGPDTYPGHMLDETYMNIRVPVVLASSPIGAGFDEVGTQNSSTFTISNKDFAADLLRFDGLDQRATKIDDGATVTYEFQVWYSFTFAKHGWFDSALEDDSNTLKVIKERMYAQDAWVAGDFPTS